MKRFVVLLLALLAITTAIAAAPFYPPIRTTYPLTTGRTLTLDFAAPKEALPFFDSAILTDRLGTLMTTSKLDADISVTFMPRNAKGDIALSISFDKIDPATADALKPVLNPYNLRCLPLAFPRDALHVLEAWLGSFLTNKSPERDASFLTNGQKIAFSVFYTFKGQSAMLTLSGSFSSFILKGVAPASRVVFNPTITYTNSKSGKIEVIRLYSDTNIPYLQSSFMFMLDPVEDPKNPGVAMPSALVYPLFGMKP